MTEKIRKIISNGEGVTVEFKECKNKLTKGVFETVCSFLNRHGGDLFLGIKDDSSIERKR